MENIKKQYKEKETDLKWDYENETRTFIDPVKQMKKEEREKQLSLTDKR